MREDLADNFADLIQAACLLAWLVFVSIVFVRAVTERPTRPRPRRRRSGLGAVHALALPDGVREGFGVVDFGSDRILHVTLSDQNHRCLLGLRGNAGAWIGASVRGAGVETVVIDRPGPGVE